MLGQTLLKTLQGNKYSVVTVSRNNSDYNIDLLVDSDKFIAIMIKEKPEIIINSAAIIDLEYCETCPGEAYIINSRLPALIAQACKITKSYFVQISTDHYYFNDSNIAHAEDHELYLLNEYARTKYAGEIFALTHKNTLVARTNIVGFRNKKGIPTFVEWIIKSLKSNEIITGYEDYYTSSIDVKTFSTILLELIQMGITGIINIASSDIISKYEFIRSLAVLLGKEEYIKKGSIKMMHGTIRANSLGLDTSKLKCLLKHNKMPSSKEVIINIFNQYKEGSYCEL